MPEVQTVKVMVRVRPLNKRQKQLQNQIIANIDPRTKQIFISKPLLKQDPKAFTFDNVFGIQSSQQTIYQQSSFQLVNSVLQGYNGTIFAYGQTGCGKTFTMMGDPSNEEIRGIIPRTFSQIMAVTGGQVETKYLVRCSFIEIYNQQIHDMLSQSPKSKMQLRESPNKGVYVENLAIQVVKTSQQMQKHMSFGFKNRAVRQTAMNKESSRSHSVFTIYIESEETDDKGTSRFKGAKLNLVDLAGSEKQKQTNAVGDGLRQAAKINLSLSALGNVISALVDGKFIPYRDSKLTRILQDSLGGNTKTIMIANISPSADSYQQSLSTLRYASRAKFIKNQPKINQDPKDALLRDYAKQIQDLKMMLEGKMPINGQVQQQQHQGGGTNLKRVINKENESQLEEELRKKEIMLNNQKQQRAKIMAQLEQLQHITTQKTSNASSKLQLQKIKKLNQKLQLQKRKQQQYLLEKKRRDEDLVDIDKKYKSLNQQVDYMKQRFKEVKNKYISSITELKDVQQQHQSQKQDLLDTIRYQQSQISKYTQILSMLISNQQVDKINRLSEWDEQTMEHKLPLFYLRDKSVMFPKMAKQQAQEYIINQKNKRQIVFRKDSFEMKRQSGTGPLRERQKEVRMPKGGSSRDMELNMIVKNAKDHFVSNESVNFNGAKNGFYGMQLSPIKGDIERKRMEKQEKAYGVKLNPL